MTRRASTTIVRRTTTDEFLATRRMWAVQTGWRVVTFDRKADAIAFKRDMARLEAQR